MTGKRKRNRDMTPAEWVASGRNLMDFPMPPHGKKLGDCTQDELEKAADIWEQESRFNHFIAQTSSKIRKG